MNATPSPGLLLGLLLSMGYAGIFHLWVGRSLRDLAAYMAAATVRFADCSMWSRAPLGPGLGLRWSSCLNRALTRRSICVSAGALAT